MKYFGTDGIRGIYGEDLTLSLAEKVGKSLSLFCERKNVLIGRDTRQSGSALTSSLTSGLVNHGVNVVDIGIAPTPVISFLTKELNADYGVVISASHNPPAYNGIKIFDSNGNKIDNCLEEQIEQNLDSFVALSPAKYEFNDNLINIYKTHFLNKFNRLDGLKIVLDCGFGASYNIAKEMFTSLGANVIAENDQPIGEKINVNCGALNPSIISNAVIKNNADIGFSFDGDADRIIVCDENGVVLDGDDILQILSDYFNCNCVVGTVMSNKGFETYLKSQNKILLRSDVGDKNVGKLMRENNVLVGGEQSGHIIISSLSPTGDATLVALTISNILKKTNKKLSQLENYKKYPQVLTNITVKDKNKILNNTELQNLINHYEKNLGVKGRVLVRASGTENKLRVMCEHEEKDVAINVCNNLKEVIEKLNSNF